MTIYIDVQHMGDPIKKGRMGAAFGDKISETEAFFTSLYAFWMGMRLRELGHEVINMSDGTYPSRHERVNEYDQRNVGGPKSIYIAAHLNAGGGSYSAMFYHHQSTHGVALAKAMNAKIKERTDISSVKAIPSCSEDWTKNAFYCIKNVGRPIAICAEPLFLDNPSHQKLLNIDGMYAIGFAMADGIHEFLEAQ